MRALKIGSAFALLATAAYAGDWPEVGDKFRLDDGTTLVVATLKAKPKVEDSLICMSKDGVKACTWAKVGKLHGGWITYGGVSAD